MNVSNGEICVTIRREITELRLLSANECHNCRQWKTEICPNVGQLARFLSARNGGAKILLDVPAQWTTPTEFGGEDPLAMLRALEVIYQKGLLPGLSSVTTRLRYYSFYAWWLTEYASREDGQSTSRIRFQHQTRRVEALFALAAMASDPGVSGLAGYYFARDKLASNNHLIDFRRETHRETPEKERYLAQLGGAFQTVYFRQMIEMGLIGNAEHHSLPVPTELGRRLADGVAASVGSLGAEFLSAAEAGVASPADLARFSVFSPSAIPTEGAEVDLLRALLLGMDGPQDSGARRGASIGAILEAAASAEARGITEGVSQNTLRWRWHAVAEEDNRDVIQLWAAYQGGDVLRICYEALLRHASQELEERYPDGQFLSSLVSDLTDSLGDCSLEVWLTTLDHAYRDLDFPALQGRAMVPGAGLDKIMAPVARLARIWGPRIDVLKRAFPPEPDAQTLLSELLYFSMIWHEPVRVAMKEILRERILLRHLRVATRKFHKQGNYTFLVDIESGVLRARDERGVAESGPRLKTAITFLEDVHLLEAGRITPRGHNWLERATAAGDDPA